MDENDGRRSSDVLDAIFEKVAEKPERSESASMLFRARALDQLDVAAEVDNQLPLVSRRSWLLLVAVGLLVAAFAVWAALTPSVTSITSNGRVMQEPGAAAIAAPMGGVLTDVVAAGTQVKAGDDVATLMTDSGPVPVRAATAGEAWQQPVVPGSTVIPGQTVVTLMPPGSSKGALLPVPEAQAYAIAPGMTVNVSALGMAFGEVAGVSGPLTAQQAGERLGIVLPGGTTYVLVSVALDQELAPGASAYGTITLSKGTVLTRLLGQT